MRACRRIKTLMRVFIIKKKDSSLLKGRNIDDKKGRKEIMCVHDDNTELSTNHGEQTTRLNLKLP
jgi:predicted KAP-like P-loop ATPase